MTDTNTLIPGADAIILALQAEGVETMFGYPGGAIMPLYDAMFRFGNQPRHILTRHEQGAIHAAQGFARVSGKTGVCITTSGPGATNLLTGLADAFADSTPLVCITGQVNARLIGSDAFQEADVLGLTTPVTKWNVRITESAELLPALAKAFYIASTGRPGPVVIDVAKNVLIEKIPYDYEICKGMPSYHPEPVPDDKKIRRAADWINQSERPLLFWGQGVLLSDASDELRLLIDKAGMPAASTLLGLSAIPSNHPLNMGMLGMHGSYAPNVLSAKADLIVAVGMRFDDRVTSDPSSFVPNARVIHIDIDASEHGKVIQPHLAVEGDAARVLKTLLEYVEPAMHKEWVAEFHALREMENDKVIAGDLSLKTEKIQMGAMIRRLSERFPANTLVVTDVGQHQMKVARYFNFSTPRQLVTSGGLGTMGFGLPASMGAKVARPEKDTVVFIGDGGFQMTIQELGTIAANNIGVKIIILNNNFLGMVRQWQERFFEARYSFVDIQSPDFITIAKGYGINGMKVSERKDLAGAIDAMFAKEEPFLLEVKVEKKENILPMIEPGLGVGDIKLE